jgi:chloramphenicol-sensitive protein RarD
MERVRIPTARTTDTETAATTREGVVYGVAAYLLWGAFPLFFPLLKPARPVEILAHRIVWSLVAVMVVLVAVRGFGSMVAVVRDRRRLALVTVAAVLIALNWGVFIYAVNSDHVIEGSLGYFINPLVSVAFGVLVFREQLRRWQIAALALGGFAVAVLTIDYGRPPWIALTLALSFGGYGLVKKLAGVGAAESLGLETLILLVPALAYLAVLQTSGDASFGTEGTGHAVLLAASGPVTAVPLLLFAASVTRVPLSLVGLMQYLVPVLQLLCGLLVFDEAMPTGRWIGFGLVWVALAVLSADGLRAARRRRTAAVPEPQLT